MASAREIRKARQRWQNQKVVAAAVRGENRWECWRSMRVGASREREYEPSGLPHFVFLCSFLGLFVHSPSSTCYTPFQ
jgi:hypothetical protein